MSNIDRVHDIVHFLGYLDMSRADDRRSLKLLCFDLYDIMRILTKKTDWGLLEYEVRKDLKKGLFTNFQVCELKRLKALIYCDQLLDSALRFFIHQ